MEVHTERKTALKTSLLFVPPERFAKVQPPLPCLVEVSGMANKPFCLPQKLRVARLMGERACSCDRPSTHAPGDPWPRRGEQHRDIPLPFACQVAANDDIHDLTQQSRYVARDSEMVSRLVLGHIHAQIKNGRCRLLAIFCWTECLTAWRTGRIGP